jgi:hypothetical protein
MKPCAKPAFLWTMQIQSTSSILMVRPSAFAYNAETATDNRFQVGDVPEKVGVLARFDAMVDDLRKAGVDVYVWNEPAGSQCPDAVFPNNWVTFHASGEVLLYPMKARSRRAERRAEVLEFVRSQGFALGPVTDLSHSENAGRFLEGTGSLVLDHLTRTAYAAISERTDVSLVREWCRRMAYEPVIFHSELRNAPVYHTNVILSIGTTWAVACPDAIVHAEERALVLNSLESSGKMILAITPFQVEQFCGNLLEVRTRANEPLIVSSNAAFDAFTPEQRIALAHHAQLIHPDVSVIEAQGGGSVRCMMAEIFSPRVIS